MLASRFSRTSSFVVTLATALVVAAFASVASASSGVAYKVKDLDPVVVPQRTFGLVPAVALGSSVLAVTAATHYQDLEPGEIWVTDGTTAGTRRVRDLRGDGVVGAAGLPGGALLAADSRVTGYELWWSDGTTSGTRLVRDIAPGAASSMPVFVGVLDGVAYFAADDGVHGRELWRSDGTAGGTWLFADLLPGSASGLPTGYGLSDTGQVYNGRLYFAADDGVHGRELWRTDGHPAGTYLLKNIAPGLASGNPRSFQVAAGRLFFTADEATHGTELWATDGSAARTALVRDIVPGAQGSNPVPMGKIPGDLVFFADSPAGQLWASDGTAAGTDVILPGFGGGVSESATVGARVVFLAWNATPYPVPWVTDGTAGGTFRLRDDLVSGWSLRPAGDFALFEATPEVGDSGLWRSDGTPAGTVRLSDAWCDHLSEPVALDGTWFYACVSEVGPHGWDAAVLERTDGTPAGTGDLLLDFPSGVGSRPRDLTARGGDLVFQAASAPDPAWRAAASDGTEAGTRPLTYTGTGWFAGFTAGTQLADGEIVFPSSAEDAGDGQVFRTDGDLVSAVSVIDNGGEWPQAFTRAGDLVFFATDQLWRTDGSAAGTQVVWPVQGFELTDVFGTLWFPGAHDYGTPTALWESRGTPATTVAHPLGFAMDSDEPNGLTPLDPATGAFAFRAAGGLYLFDPASGQARRLGDFSETAPPHYLPFPRAVVDRTLFYFDGDPDGTLVLWKSDGTATGTVRVANIGAPDRLQPEIVALGTRVYFRGCDAARGCELWRSDGTAAGTGRLVDLDPGIFSSMPSELTVVGNRLYFSACDAWHGCEPWATDGSAAGTHRLGDIAPGSDSSRVSALTRAGRRVFFSADDDTGEELWAVPAELFYDGFETGDTSRW